MGLFKCVKKRRIRGSAEYQVFATNQRRMRPAIRVVVVASTYVETLMANVFVLYFTGPGSGGRTIGRFLGVFSSQANAARAVERLQRLPRYRDHPKGFQLEAVELDVETDLGECGPPPPVPLPPPE